MALDLFEPLKFFCIYRKKEDQNSIKSTPPCILASSKGNNLHGFLLISLVKEILPNRGLLIKDQNVSKGANSVKKLLFEGRQNK